MEHLQSFESVYEDVITRAAYLLRRETTGHAFDVDALVAEAWLRGFGGNRIAFSNRDHALAVATLSLRRVLIDEARRRKAVRRGGDNAAASVVSYAPCDLARLPVASDGDRRRHALRLALLRLERQSPELARIVSLKFNHGLEHTQIGLELGISASSVKRQWLRARELLRSFLECSAVMSRSN